MRRAAHRFRRSIRRRRRRCCARRTPPPKTLCLSGYHNGPPTCAKSRAKKQPGGGGHSGENDREEEGERNVRNFVCKFGTGNRKCYDSNLSCCRRREKRAGCGRVWSRNICFDHVLIVVRQGRQRRDASAPGEEQKKRFAAGQRKYYRLNVNSGNLILAALYLRRGRVVGHSIAAVSTQRRLHLLHITSPCFFRISLISCFLQKF
jgi:hypothetical protein